MATVIKDLVIRFEVDNLSPEKRRLIAEAGMTTPTKPTGITAGAAEALLDLVDKHGVEGATGRLQASLTAPTDGRA